MTDFSRMSSDRFLLDATSIVLLLAVALAGSYLPVYLLNRGKLHHGEERSLAFQLGSMLSAGVMISAGFCHLLAGSLEILMEKVPIFPLGPFLCASGFLLTLMAEQFAKSISNYVPLCLIDKKSETNKLLISESDSDAPPQTSQISIEFKKATCCDIGPLTNKPPHISFLTAVFLGAALSIHSILEGLALGATKSFATSFDIFIAILAHKGLAAYALGASLADSRTTTKKFWSVIIFFSSATPVGIIIGIMLSEFTDSMVSSCLSAAAAGTFLYVALMEIMPKELADRKNINSKLLTLLLGFGLMSLLAIWA